MPKLEHTFRAGDDGASTADPLALVRLVLDAIDGALAGNHDPVDAVGMSCFWHAIAGVDELGRPVTRLLTWADSRARPAAERLRERLDPEAYRLRTGAPLHSSFWPAKLELLGPRLAARWEGPAETLYRHLFGVARASTSMAAGTGLLDTRSGAWDALTLEALDLDPSRLPELSDAPLGPLPGRWARRWPALRRAAWYPALGDGVCANLGSGCVGPDVLALSIGTSAALRALVPMPVGLEVPRGLFAYPLDAPGPGSRRLVGAALSSGGNLRKWGKRVLADVDLDQVARGPAGLHGLTLLPFLAGDRSPDWSSRAEGSLHGLTLATTAEDLARVLLEAVALGIARVRPLLEPVAPGARIVVSGGGAGRYGQMVADALGEPVWRSSIVEASLAGAAAHALERLGRPVVGRLPRSRPLEPEPAAHARYQEALARHDELLARVWPAGA